MVNVGDVDIDFFMLLLGLDELLGEGFFGAPPGKPNPYQMDTDENLARGLRYLLETDLRAELETVAPTIRCPVAIYHSEHDGIVRPENAAYLKRLFPQAALTMVPGTEHALPIFVPELIDRTVAAAELSDSI